MTYANYNTVITSSTGINIPSGMPMPEDIEKECKQMGVAIEILTMFPDYDEYSQQFWFRYDLKFNNREDMHLFLVTSKYAEKLDSYKIECSYAH